MKAVRTTKDTEKGKRLPQSVEPGGQAEPGRPTANGRCAGAGEQEGLDAQILRRFRALRREEQAQFLTIFESALKTQSWPASGCHQPEQEAL